MRSLFQHRSEPEEFSVRGFVDHNFLVLLVKRRDPHAPGYHHVGPAAAIADLVDPLPGRERLQLHLSGQYRGFFFVEQGEKRNVF